MKILATVCSAAGHKKLKDKRGMFEKTSSKLHAKLGEVFIYKNVSIILIFIGFLIENIKQPQYGYDRSGQYCKIAGKLRQFLLVYIIHLNFFCAGCPFSLGDQCT
jgi:hypothetical protein